MRNVSGYMTDDGKFYEDKKQAEAHEKMLAMGKHIDEFVRVRWDSKMMPADLIRAWEKYKAEAVNK